MQEAEGSIPISTNPIPIEVRKGRLPTQPSSVDSAEWPGNRDWGLN